MVIAQTERDIARQAAQSAQNAKTAMKPRCQSRAGSAAGQPRQVAPVTSRRTHCAESPSNDENVEAIPEIPLEDGDIFYVPAVPSW